MDDRQNLAIIFKNVIKSTHFSRRRNHPCRGPARRRSRRPRLLGWRMASRSPCSPACRVERGRIWPVGCWKNEDRARSLVRGSGSAAIAGWYYVNQCSTLRCYKRTRCERGYTPVAEEGSGGEMHSGVWHVENNGGHATWNDRLSRVFRPSTRVPAVTVRHVECRELYYSYRTDLKSAARSRDRGNLSRKFQDTRGETRGKTSIRQ